MEEDIKSDFDPVIYDIPERGLIAAVINFAFADACQTTKNSEFGGIAYDGMDFLMSSRSDPWFELLEINPEAARESLLNKTSVLPCYAKFRFWYRVWKNRIRISSSGKIKTGLPRQKSSVTGKLY